MKTWMLHSASSVAVGLAFIGVSHIEPSGWRLIGLFAAISLLQALYIPRYPKDAALLQFLHKLKPGEKVEVEGK